MQEVALRQDVLDSFLVLQSTLQELCNAVIREPELVAWVQEESQNTLFVGNLTAREKATLIFKQLEYQSLQAPREIIVLPGFIGASLSTLDKVMAVNEAKDQFKKSMLALKANVKPTNLTNAMAEMGMARLHLKQCYRKIPILKCAPQKMSWTWAHTKSIKRISIAKASELLLKKGEDLGIQIQLQKLNSLSPNEQLAIVQELAPHLRANIVLSDENATRLMIKGPVPIFFPCSLETPYPAFKVPLKKTLRDEKRSIRNDVRLDPMPFLPAIRAHRYT
ncbi:MAG: hypothetical protein AB7I18_05670 [Candidatus Berkiella sp.]